MPTYTYRARDNRGELREASIDAESSVTAKEILKQEGLWVVELEELGQNESAFQDNNPFNTTESQKTKDGKDKPFLLDFREKYQPITLKDMVIFSRQFASMIEAGVAMLRALNVLTEQTENPRLRKSLEVIKYDIEQGGTLSGALGKHPKIFDRLYVSMVKAGEAGGILDQVLDRLAGFIEERSRLTQQVKSAMTYPVVVMLIAVVVFYAMLTLVLPTFSGLFKSLGSDLPAYTKLLIKVSEFLRSWYMLLIFFIIGFGSWSLRKWYMTKDGKYIIDSLFLTVPVLGDIVKKVSVARFTRTFGTLIKSGVPIVTALEVVKDSSDNAVLAKAVDSVISKVQAGGTISSPLGQSKIFPPMVTQMVAIGEETGQLEIMLEKVADFYDIEVETAVEGLTSLMEPIMIVTLGGLVGAIVIGMYLPMFTIISKIQ